MHSRHDDSIYKLPGPQPIIKSMPFPTAAFMQRSAQCNYSYLLFNFRIIEWFSLYNYKVIRQSSEMWVFSQLDLLQDLVP